MTQVPQASTGDAFNARFLPSAQVGSTFVSSPALREALLPRHTVLIGPRGSGKTTLLKMLTLPALLQWKGRERDASLAGLDFVSVYVAASLTWSASFRSFSAIDVASDVERLLSVSLFRHHVLLALIDTWENLRDPHLSRDPILKRFHLPAEEAVDAAFIRALAEGWGLRILTSTRSGITRAVKERIRELQRLAVRTAYVATDAGRILEEHEDLTSHFLDDATTFLDLTAEHYARTTRLALCFDEVEITTAAVAKVIVSSVRSVDQRILIKYSAAPYLGISAEDLMPHAPSRGNDYGLVFLTTFASRDARPFSEALFRSLATRRGEGSNIEEILGQSLIDDNVRDDLGKYGPGGAYQRRFAHLAQIDESFREYARSKELDLADLRRGDEAKRAADVRKILWPVVIRDEILFDKRDEGSKPRRRLRSKSAIADCYTGANALLAICEGNPRWIIGLMEPLLEQSRGEGPEADPKRRRPAQKRALEVMIANYFALLSTVPSIDRGRGPATLVDLVERIGGHFRDGVLSTRFNADPVLSFTVDDGVLEPVKDLIGRGINLGAFITTPRSGGEGYRVGDVVGLKIRLSNVFAPHYNLPLIGGRTVSISTILERTRPHASAEKVVADLFEGLR